MVRTTAQSWLWQLFAIVVVLFSGRIVLDFATSGGGWTLVKSLAGLTALVGLAGYAFGFRIGPLPFWRVFACCFSLGLMMKFGQKVGVPFAAGGKYPPTVSFVAAMLFALVCLALFRHAELTWGGRSKASKYRDVFS
jgi:hypothetical protein